MVSIEEDTEKVIMTLPNEKDTKSGCALQGSYIRPSKDTHVTSKCNSSIMGQRKRRNILCYPSYL